MALDGAVKSVNREVEAKARSLAEEIPMQQIGYFILFVREMSVWSLSGNCVGVAKPLD
jgi:hypothetical protein